VVLNAFFPAGHNPGGFRCWRRLHGSDDQLDDTHLMRMAGRFARRVKAWAAANGVPLIFCKAGERKHLIAEQYLEENSVSPGVFLILAAKAPATVWKVRRSARGVITRLEKKREHVYRYSFHIMDPAFGHLTIKMSGHPPFGAQVILNGHEYVAVAAQAEGIGFTKEGDCFTGIADPQGLARVADAWPRDAAIGRLGQVCDRWIYSACLCFGLDLEEQERSGFRYGYSVYQAEYSRNLLFKSGAQMEALSGRVLDRTRSRLDIPAIRTIFGLKNRPHRNRKDGPPAQEIVIEKPRYGLSWFRISFGCSSRPAPRASTCCVSRPPCTTPKSCAAAAAWTTSTRSSPCWPRWRTGSPPPWTAPALASCPTACSMSCPCQPRPGHAGSPGST
jgi:hypothetical protein